MPSASAARTRPTQFTRPALLRFRPIMMTTMAALLAGLPLALGTGFGSELRRPLGIAMVGGLLLSQALTLYTTPVIYIFFDNLAHRFAPQIEPSRGREAQNLRGRHEHLRTFHPPAGGHDAAHGGDRPCRGDCVSGAAGVAAAAGRLSDHFRQRQPAGRQRRDHGLVRRHSAGAAVRSYRRRDGDDLGQLARQHLSHDSVRSEPRYRRRGARCRGRPSMPRAPICPPTCRPIRPIARSIPPTRRS